MLTEAQIRYFRLFGWLPLHGLFSSEELSLVVSEYEQGLAAAARLYVEPIGVRGQQNWSSMGPETPFLEGALEHPRLLEVATGLLGPAPMGVMTNGNCFSGRMTEWHCDTSQPGFRSVKLVAYLDPLDAGSGALRILPGSHKSPWHEDLFAIGAKADRDNAGNPETVEDAGLAITNIPAQVCVSSPGDVFAFDLRTWHASWNGSPRRRMVSFTYFAEPADDAERESVRAVAAQLKRELMFRELRRQRDWLKAGTPPAQVPQREPQYPDSWLGNPLGDPRRIRWVKTLADLGLCRRPPRATSTSA